MLLSIIVNGINDDAKLFATPPTFCDIFVNYWPIQWCDISLLPFVASGVGTKKSKQSHLDVIFCYFFLHHPHVQAPAHFPPHRPTLPQLQLHQPPQPPPLPQQPQPPSHHHAHLEKIAV